jgi:hypothetical protein
MNWAVGHIRGERHIMHVARAEQRLNVRMMRMLVERINEEEYGVDADPGGCQDDSVACQPLAPTLS